MNKAVLILLVVGTTLGFILILAVMVYCTFRARHLARRSNFPVFVIPSPGQRERMDFRQDLEQGGHAGEIPGHRNSSFEAIELKKYRRFTDLNCVEKQQNGIENPVFDPGPSTSKAGTPLEKDSNISQANSFRRTQPGRRGGESNEGSPESFPPSSQQQPEPTPRSSSPPSPSHVRPRPSPSHGKFPPSSPPTLSLSKFPNDFLAVELEHRGQIRSRQMRMSQESFRRSQNFSADATTPDSQPPASPRPPTNEKEESEKESSPRPASWSPSPIIQSSYKLSRELAEIIASDRVAESSVMIEGTLDPLSGTMIWPDPESVRRRSRNSLSTLDPIQEGGGEVRVPTPGSGTSLPFADSYPHSVPELSALSGTNSRNQQQRVELVFKQRTAV